MMNARRRIAIACLPTSPGNRAAIDEILARVSTLHGLGAVNVSADAGSTIVTYDIDRVPREHRRAVAGVVSQLVEFDRMGLLDVTPTDTPSATYPDPGPAQALALAVLSSAGSRGATAGAVALAVGKPTKKASKLLSSLQKHGMATPEGVHCSPTPSDRVRWAIAQAYAPAYAAWLAGRR